MTNTQGDMTSSIALAADAGMAMDVRIVPKDVRASRREDDVIIFISRAVVLGVAAD